MIDRYITHFQEGIILFSNSFVYRNTGPYSGTEGTMALGRLENRIVMSLGISLTNLIDYLKLPLATIEELAQAILFTPLAPLKEDFSARCFKHYSYTFKYLKLLAIKITKGIVYDLYTVREGFLHPHKFPSLFPPSYCGSGALYGNPHHTEEESRNPSIFLPVFIW